MKRKSLSVVPGTFMIHRLLPTTPIPPDILDASFVWTARTREELSIVCPSSVRIDSVHTDAGWSCIKVKGPLDFAETGVLASIADALAEVEISLFALSTFDTDYVLVKSERLESALTALHDRGWTHDQDTSRAVST